MEGDKGTALPPLNSNVEKIRGFWLTHRCNIVIAVFSFWDFTPRSHMQWQIQDLPKKGIVASARASRA